jgi:hypothetical protein
MNEIRSATSVHLLLIGLAAIGTTVVINFVGNIIAFFYAHFLRPSKNISKSFGEWAVVTGATDGIGKGFSHIISGFIRIDFILKLLLFSQ